jgi:hypothetical protein
MILTETDVREARATYTARARGAFHAAREELEAFFDNVGHVSPPASLGGESDAIRSAPPHVRQMLYGTPRDGRLEADVWLDLVARRLPQLSTMEAAVGHVEALIERRTVLGRASRPGASQDDVRTACLTLAEDADEGDHVAALFTGTLADAARSLSLLRTADVRWAEMKAPRLSNSDPQLIWDAIDCAERFEKAEKALEDARQERDAMVAFLRASGWGYDRIARALSMSKQRVVQLCRELPVPKARQRAMSVVGDDF